MDSGNAKRRETDGSTERKFSQRLSYVSLCRSKRSGMRMHRRTISTDKNMPTFTWWIDKPLIREAAILPMKIFKRFVLMVLRLQFRCWNKASSLRVTTSNQPQPPAGLSIPFRSKKVLHPHLNRFASSWFCWSPYRPKRKCSCSARAGRAARHVWERRT